MPATVSPAWNCAAFSSHVPSSSLWVRRIFFALPALEYHPKLLPDREPVGGVGNPGNGYAVNGNQGGQSAADVHKAAEGLQMGYTGGENISRTTSVQVLGQAALLGSPPGKNGKRCACLVTGQLRNHKAYRLVHPGDQRNIPGGALPDPHCPLLPRDDRLHAGQLHPKVVGAVADGDSALQDGAPFHCLRKPCRGADCPFVFFCLNPVAFW